MAIDPPHPQDDRALLSRARERLRAPPAREQHWAALGAAALFAVCAIVFAVAAVMAPPLSYQPAAKVGVK